MSDPGRLAELLSAAKIENELDKKHWEGVRDQYRLFGSLLSTWFDERKRKKKSWPYKRALDSLLERLPDKRVHQAMIPLSKIAFCPGRLVHTNEVMGEFWFSDKLIVFGVLSFTGWQILCKDISQNCARNCRTSNEANWEAIGKEWNCWYPNYRKVFIFENIDRKLIVAV